MLTSPLLTFLIILKFTMSGVSPDSVARTRIDAMNRHDVEAIAKLYPEQAVIEISSLNEPRTGPAGAREIYSRFFATSPDLHYEITSVVEGKDAVVVEYTSTGT